MLDSIVTQNVIDSQPVFFPTDETNRRPARCARCGMVLPKGSGRKWDWSDFAYQYTIALRPRYLCRNCSDHQQALNEIEPVLKSALAEIETWCLRYVNLNMGSHASRHIEAMVRRCDLAAAEVAWGILNQLQQQDDFSYGAVINIAKRVIREFEQGEAL